MKKTVTIGIPAHNEEHNIANLLSDILMQQGDNFVIKRITVVCDGCSDRTAEIVQQISNTNPIVKVINDGRRIGQAARLNELYSKVTTDIFITFDADTRLGTKHVVKLLVNAFDTPRVGLVGGRVHLQPQKTFISKALEAQHYFWGKVIDSFHNGQNLQSHTGPISAASRAFLSTVQRPAHLVANDQFLYFAALRNGFEYRSVPQAFVYIKVPTTFTDYMRQTTRFLDSADELKKYFGTWVNEYYAIPYAKKIVAYWKAFRRYPIYLPVAILLVTLQRFLHSMYRETTTGGVWTSVQSTK